MEVLIGAVLCFLAIYFTIQAAVAFGNVLVEGTSLFASGVAELFSKPSTGSRQATPPPSTPEKPKETAKPTPAFKPLPKGSYRASVILSLYD